jgi:ATP-dependent protease ClpP protease subunit
MADILIRSQKKVINIYNIDFIGAIDSPDDFKEFFKLLNDVSDKDKINISISSNGGCCRTGAKIIDAIQSSKAFIHMIVTYPTMSMGSTIALSGDSLEFKKDAYLMFHNYSTGMEGKGNELMGRVENYIRYFQAHFRRICKPFLTERECVDMFNGKDIYITSEDDLELRIRRHFK